MTFGFLPELTGDAFVRWRAQQISDPVEKLRYLRARQSVPAGPAVRHWPKRAGVVVAGVLLATALGTPVASTVRSQPAAVEPHQSAPLPAPVWLVRADSGTEIYSNGLRIDTAATATNEPRKFRRLVRRNGDLIPEPGTLREPAGIVFHTTESLMEPLGPDYNQRLRHATAEMLRHVQRHRSYHFVIDRFGAVNRVVRESDSADHAGNSAWAAGEQIYLNLNQAFLGIAIEAGTQTADGYAAATPAQIHSARLLTDLLRSRYSIPAENCVTHAQVSLNPSNMRIGYHTDWARNFPFEALGLADNYRLPPPSVRDFGFTWDAALLEKAGGTPWPGLHSAERLMADEAAESGRSLADQRTLGQQRYRKFIAGLHAGIWKEPDHVSNPLP